MGRAPTRRSAATATSQGHTWWSWCAAAGSRTRSGNPPDTRTPRCPNPPGGRPGRLSTAADRPGEASPAAAADRQQPRCTRVPVARRGSTLLQSNDLSRLLRRCPRSPACPSSSATRTRKLDGLLDRVSRAVPRPPAGRAGPSRSPRTSSTGRAGASSSSGRPPKAVSPGRLSGGVTGWLRHAAGGMAEGDARRDAQARWRNRGTGLPGSRGG